MILGLHTLIELSGCDPARLRDVAAIRALMIAAVAEAGGTYVTDVFHHFAPHGVSGVIVIAESHVTIHTWPEHAYAAVDVFTCGERFQHAVFVRRMREGLAAVSLKEQTLPRGPANAGCA